MKLTRRVRAEMRRLAPRPSHDRADESQARATLYPRPRVGIDVTPRSCPTLTGEGIASEPRSGTSPANGSARETGRESAALSPVERLPEDHA